MASSLNSKRVILLMMAVLGLAAAAVCIVILALGVREASRERLFLVGSIVIVSLVCLFLGLHFKDEALELEAQMARAEDDAAQTPGDSGDPDAFDDPDEVALPQNRGASAAGKPQPGSASAHASTPAPDPDDVQLPQNAPASPPKDA